MTVKPKDIIKRGGDDEFLENFIETATTAMTADMNATRVASEVHLARTIKITGDSLENAIGSMTASLTKAMADHALALTRSAQASEKHAKSLTWATWALVCATVILAIIAFLPYLQGCPK